MYCNHRAILNLLPWDYNNLDHIPLDRYEPYAGVLYNDNDDYGITLNECYDCQQVCTGCGEQCTYHQGGWQPFNAAGTNLICMCTVCAKHLRAAYQEAAHHNPNFAVSKIIQIVSRVALVRSIINGSTPHALTRTHSNFPIACDWCMVCRESHDVCERELLHVLYDVDPVQEAAVLSCAFPLLIDITRQIRAYLWRLTQTDNVDLLLTGKRPQIDDQSYAPIPYIVDGLDPTFTDVHLLIMQWAAEQPVFIKSCDEGYDLWHHSHHNADEEYIASIVVPTDDLPVMTMLIEDVECDQYGIDIPVFDKRRYLSCVNFYVVFNGGVCGVCSKFCNSHYGVYDCTNCDEARSFFKKVNCAARFWILVGSLCELPPDIVRFIAHKIDLFSLTYI